MVERLVVIGGDAGGMAAASLVRRRRADFDIVAVERGQWTSYSACGIPYVVSGAVSDLERLIARTPQQFREQRIDVRVGHEATSIDLAARKVEVHDAAHHRTINLAFDHLLIATGARPLRPDLPGIDSDEIHGVQTLDDAAHLLHHVERIGARRVVVVGGGYIGLEMAEAFLERGALVTVVEAAPHVMRALDPDMAALVAAAMTKRGIDVLAGLPVTGFEPGRVVTADGPIAADLIVLGLGVVPNSELAAAAGLTLGPRSAIAVDARQRTSADGVWAAGDCATSFHQISKRPTHIALGTVANRQSRVAGINIAGGYATFPGVLGTAVTKICSTEIGRVGLTTAECEQLGLESVAATIETTTRSSYFPGAKRLTVKLLAERVTGRLLGAQIVGEENAAKRIDVFATAMTAGMTVAEIADLDLSYAPPFAPLWDAVLIAARQAAAAVDERG